MRDANLGHQNPTTSLIRIGRAAESSTGDSELWLLYEADSEIFLWTFELHD